VSNVVILKLIVMEEAANKNDIIEKLKKEILLMQGFSAVLDHGRLDIGLGPMEKAFPNHIFPTAAVHEVVSNHPAAAAATTGFMAGLISHLMKTEGTCLWVGTRRQLFPPGLKAFGISPDRVIFIDLQRERDVLWAIEESLKCSAVTAVVAELKEISLTESRRLQLAVEKSRVTGFLHRCNPQKINHIASVSRWEISPIISHLEAGVPGVGYPRWNVELQKIRNGKPGSWQLEWSAGRFSHLETAATPNTLIQQTG
jgi:protein ImuA